MRCADQPVGEPLPNPHAVDAAVALFAALAHPVRLTVLLALSRQEGLTVGQLTELAQAEQSAMSHQLRALRDARLVTSERDGRRIRYRLHDEHVAHIIEDALTHAVDEVANIERDLGSASR